jgi:protein-S-isoprenylcysteine O-methyltransferase Ste14
LFAAVWFGLAGRLTWWQGWAVLLSFSLLLVLVYFRLARDNPDLLRERNQPAEVAESWDRRIMRIYSILLVILWIISALDAGRFQWSRVAAGIQLLGWLMLIGSGAIIWRVLQINAYLSSWARLQPDRGQVVIQEGPYRLIRHPMYLGIIIAFIGMPLALASWWAQVPAVLIGLLYIYRTYREDRMLMQGLPGYPEYANRVKFRLIPGIW